MGRGKSGAGSWRIWHVVLPNILPGVIGGAILHSSFHSILSRCRFSAESSFVPLPSALRIRPDRISPVLCRDIDLVDHVHGSPFTRPRGSPDSMSCLEFAVNMTQYRS
jgi:hypothetical protein